LEEERITQKSPYHVVVHHRAAHRHGAEQQASEEPRAVLQLAEVLDGLLARPHVGDARADLHRVVAQCKLNLKKQRLVKTRKSLDRKSLETRRVQYVGQLVPPHHVLGNLLGRILQVQVIAVQVDPHLKANFETGFSLHRFQRVETRRFQAARYCRRNM
jgi:hypothetical protein